MKFCEIFHVPHQGSFAWKWRHRAADGRVVQSKESYQLYYECVAAALREGYQPEMKCFVPGDGHVVRDPA